MGLAVLLIMGFSRVAHDLLSRGIFEAPSCQNEEYLEQIDHDSGHLKPECTNARATQDAPVTQIADWSRK
jgi:hypothetical protein